MKLRAFLAVVVVVSAAVLFVQPVASAGAAVEGCAKLDHRNNLNPSHQTQFKVATDGQASSGACVPTTYELLEAHCINVNLKYRRDGASAPANPSVWEVYWYFGSTENDHGANGASNWAQYAKLQSYTASPDGQAWEVCATTNGAPEGEPRAGTYRLVLRTCTTSGGRTTCNGGANSVDINSDVNPTSGGQGAAGVGQTAVGHPAGVTALENPNIMDPLWVWTLAEYRLGEQVNFSIHSEFDNGTARTGGASNITIFLRAPDGSYPVNNQTVTEVTYPADHPLKGNYYFHHTPTQTGVYSVTVQTIMSTNVTRTSKPWGFLVATPTVGGVSAYGAYSWDTHDLSVVARVVDYNGTARSGLAVGFKLFQPDGTPSTTGTMTAGNLPGTYTAKTYVGTDPMLGPWTAYVEVPAQSDGGGNLSAVVSVVVSENLTLMLEDARQFATDMWASFNASFTYTNSLLNASRVEVLASIASLAANATNGPAPWAAFTMTGEAGGPAPGYYANRSVKFQAQASNNASWGPLLYLWDFGDNTTASGPVAYHKFWEGGNYSVSLSVFTATGNTTTTTRTISVNESVPWANVTGPKHPLQWHKVTYDARGSVDHYDDIVRVEWAVNPGEYHDIPFIGSLSLNAGSGVGMMFNYTWALVGNQTIRVNVTNSHGHTNVTWYNVTVHDAVRFEQTRNEYPDYGQLGEDMASGAQKGVDRIQRFVKFWAWVAGGFRG